MEERKRKILFINPPLTRIDDLEDTNFIMKRQSVECIPYGILSICSYIKEYTKNNLEIQVVDLNIETYKAYLNNTTDLKTYMFKILGTAINDFKPDIVGISVMFAISYFYLDSTVKCIKNYNNDAIVIVGGNIASTLYEEIIQNENIDAVCYGEGEIPILQLVDSDNLLENINENPAFVTKKSLKTGKKPVNYILKDLNILPFIDFSFIDFISYEKQNIRLFQKSWDKIKDEPPTLVIYTSRGCPYNCCFCACTLLHGKKIRHMSVDKVVGDIKEMISRYNIQCLFINDDNFLFDIKRAKTILKEIFKLNIKINITSILVKNIDDEVAELLKKLGVSIQLVSIESGSDYVLQNIIHKPLKKHQIVKAVESLKKFGISCNTQVVIGFPGETDEHRQETLKTIYDTGFNWVFYYIAYPIPGTTLYRQCVENGYLVNKDFITQDLSKCNIRTPDYKPEHIEKQAYMMNLHSNFVFSYNLRIGNYDKCILYFNNIAKLHPDHAFAYYGLMKAYDGIGESQLSLLNKNKFIAIVNSDPYWREWAEYFKLI